MVEDDSLYHIAEDSLHLAKLKSLDLSLNRLTTRSAQMILDKIKFPSLRKLSIASNLLTGALILDD